MFPVQENAQLIQAFSHHILVYRFIRILSTFFSIILKKISFFVCFSLFFLQLLSS